jgi:hypothetical protein
MDTRRNTFIVVWNHPSLLIWINLTVVVNNWLTRPAVVTRRSQIINILFARLVPVLVLFILLHHEILHRPLNFTVIARVFWFFTIVSVIFRALAENWAHGLWVYGETFFILDKFHATSLLWTAGALDLHFLLLRWSEILVVGKLRAHFVLNDFLQSQTYLLFLSNAWNHLIFAKLRAHCIHQHLFSIFFYV